MPRWKSTLTRKGQANERVPGIICLLLRAHPDATVAHAAYSLYPPEATER